MTRRAVFLDRDGVLNRVFLRDGKPYPPANVEDLEIPPDVPIALEKLHRAGFVLIVVTNQPDVTRGTQTRDVVQSIHEYLAAQLPLDAIYCCYEDDDACPRRKPNPGMLQEAATTWGIALAESYMIGDRWKDVEAGQRAGCRTVFLDCGYEEPKPDPPANFTGSCLSEAADWILARVSGKD